MRYLSFIFLAFAGVFKAISDTLAHHFDTSVFKSLPREFWDPNTSWKTAQIIFAYKVDAWHLSNSAMIACFCLAMMLHKDPIWEEVQERGWGRKRGPLYYTLYLTTLGMLFISVFNTFYNHILN